MRGGWRILLAGLALCAVATSSPRAQTLTADLSSHVIGITTGFAGADLVLFGSTDRPGDVVVVVRGPATTMLIRKKKKVLGIWINGRSTTFRDAPTFYEAAANRPIEEIAAPETLARYGIGLDNIHLQPPATDPDLAPFRAALVGNQERADLYRREVAHVTFLGEHLFRTDIGFPANVPTGNYTVEVILLAGGQVLSAQTTPLIVSRIGFSNGVFAVANQHAAVYGAGALAFAVAAGWAAGAIFRRV